MDIDDALEKKGCKQQFDELQLCLHENNRNWTKCQNLVKQWRECFNQAKQLKQVKNLSNNPNEAK